MKKLKIYWAELPTGEIRYVAENGACAHIIRRGKGSTYLAIPWSNSGSDHRNGMISDDRAKAYVEINYEETFGKDVCEFIEVQAEHLMHPENRRGYENRIICKIMNSVYTERLKKKDCNCNNKKQIMELKDTIEMMTSADYKERFKAEYYQTAIRAKKLLDMIERYSVGMLDFEPACPIAVLKSQHIEMLSLLGTYKARADYECIELEEV